MYCDDCGYDLKEATICPICGWSAEQNNASISQPVRPIYDTPKPANIAPNYAQNNMPNNPQANPMPNNPQTNPIPNNVQTNPIPNNPQANPMPNNMPFNPMPNQYGTPSPAVKQKNVKPKSKLPLIIVLILVLAGGITGAVFLLGKNKDDDSKKSNDNPTVDLSSEDNHITTEQNTFPTTEEATASSEETTEVIATTGGTRTIMMYIVGSNLESEQSSATSDLNEIFSANFDESKVNYIVYTGGSKTWHTAGIDAEKNSTYIVENSSLKMLDEAPAKNMGEAGTLADFLTYCHDNYPADQYDLILWNHGGGLFFGYGIDELSNDSLSLDEIVTALSASPFGSSKKLDFIGFDACLMAGIEIADALSPYANYLISSQETEPGWGWDYAFLNDIENMNNGLEIGTSIIDNYIGTCENNFTAYPYTKSDVTLSIIDLSKTDDVENALNNLGVAANSDLSASTFSSFSQIRTRTKRIAADFQGESSYDVVDLKSLALSMQTVYPLEAAELSNAVDDLVLYNGSNENGAYGVSLYWPQEAKEYCTYYTAYYTILGFAPEYAQFINNYAVLLTDSGTLSSDYATTSLTPYMSGDYSFSLDLTDEQMSDITGASYVISHTDPYNEKNLCFVAMSTDISFSPDNVLTAQFDGNIIYMQNNKTKQMFEIMYTQQETTTLYTRYLIPSILYNDSIDDEDALYAYFVLETSGLNPTGNIIGCYPILNYVQSNGTDIYPSRYEIDINNYKNVAFGNLSHEYTATENLDEYDASDWQDIALGYTTMPISDGFSTVRGPMLDDLPYFGMFIIEDSQGKKHGSGLVQIK